MLGSCHSAWHMWELYRWILNWSLSMHWGCCSHDITNCSGCSAGGQYSQEHSRTHCGWSSSTSWLEQCLFFVSSQINNTPFSSTMELDDSVVLPLEFEMLYQDKQMDDTISKVSWNLPQGSSSLPPPQAFLSFGSSWNGKGHIGRVFLLISPMVFLMRLPPTVCGMRMETLK